MGSNPQYIYLVDDDLFVLEVTKEIIALSGLKVVAFTDPVAAFEAFRQERQQPQVLVTDFNMPGMTGEELIARCKAISPGLRTILISGTVELAEVETHPVQADAFLAKPYLSVELLDLIKKLW